MFALIMLEHLVLQDGAWACCIQRYTTVVVTLAHFDYEKLSFVYVCWGGGRRALYIRLNSLPMSSIPRVHWTPGLGCLVCVAKRKIKHPQTIIWNVEKQYTTTYGNLKGKTEESIDTIVN